MYQAIPAALPKYPAPAPGPLSNIVQYYEEDDFACGGVAATGAVIIPTNATFGTLNWRCGSSGGVAAATTLVTTGQGTSERGVVEVNVGTGAGALQGFGRSAIAVPTTTFGGGVQREWDWVFTIPTLSTGAQEFACRFGYLQSPAAALTDGIFLETSSAAPGLGNIVGRAFKASVATEATGGATVAAVAGQKHRARVQFDGTNAYYFVDEVYVGTVAAANLPTAAVVECVSIVRTVGATSRTMLINGFRQVRPAV
jgi:hypothetical protein